MSRDITITFDDGTSHQYKGAPDDITPEQVTERATKEFAGKKITALDGGRKPEAPKPEFENTVEGRAKRGAEGLVGAAENVAHMVTGAVAPVIGGLHGAATLAADLAEGSGKDYAVAHAAHTVEDTSKALTYEPKTELGQKYEKKVASVLEPVGKVLKYAPEHSGDYIFEKTGSAGLATAANVSVESIQQIALTMLGLRAPVAAAEASALTKGAISTAARKVANSSAAETLSDVKQSVLETTGWDTKQLQAKAPKIFAEAAQKNLDKGLKDGSLPPDVHADLSNVVQSISEMTPKEAKAALKKYDKETLQKLLPSLGERVVKGAAEGAVKGVSKSFHSPLTGAGLLVGGPIGAGKVAGGYGLVGAVKGANQALQERISISSLSQ